MADLLTVPEVAAILRLTPAAIYGLVRSNLLPAVRVGRRIRVARQALEAFVAAGGRAWPCGWRKRSAEGGRAA